MLPSGEKSRTSRTLVIESVDRHEAGVYVCEAHNGVGHDKAKGSGEGRGGQGVVGSVDRGGGRKLEQ